MKEVKYSCKWQSPSNIALIKYWGKVGEKQIPLNPSLSFSLNDCVSTTEVSAYHQNEIGISFEYYFAGERKPAFEQKIKNLLILMSKHFSWILSHHLVISSENSFPHSAGIASSASSMSALSLCILDIENQINKLEMDLEQASYFARLGSGSACRSLFPAYVSWGALKPIKNSSDEFASPLDSSNIHPIFHEIQDSILIVSSKPKAISSTQGHNTMVFHPYKKGRKTQAIYNLAELLNSLESGDFKQFAQICENEALSLHALMLSANPGFFLMEKNTMELIGKIRDFREQKGIKLCFTLDAGPNIHLLYPKEEKEQVRSFIDNELLDLCENRQVIHDQIGNGPKKIEIE